MISFDSPIYFDNAATSWPKPESVYVAMDEFARHHAGNPGRGGHAFAVAAENAMLSTRAVLAKMLNAKSPERIALLANATDALNTAIKGVLRAGDHVVTSSIEHNSIVRPLAKLEKDGVVTVSRVSCGEDTLIAPDDVARAITSRTKLIALTACSNVTGALQPIGELARVAKERGVLLLLDASQIAGVVPFDVRALGVAMLAAPGHKALLGPTGTGFLYVREGVELATLREGGSGTNSDDPMHPLAMPQHLEAGTPNVVGAAGLAAGVKFAAAQPALAHERALAEKFRAGVKGRVKIYGPKRAADRVGIVSVTFNGMSPTDAAAILEQNFNIAVRAGLHCAPGAHAAIASGEGTVRFSFGAFNTEEEIDRAIAAVHELAAV